MPINSTLKEPDSPGEWVNCEVCHACGELYVSFRAGVTFQEGCNLVRAQNRDNGGGYRSRGPVLWAMRVQKLRAWYERHMYCGGWK